MALCKIIGVVFDQVRAAALHAAQHSSIPVFQPSILLHRAGFPGLSQTDSTLFRRNRHSNAIMKMTSPKTVWVVPAVRS